MNNIILIGMPGCGKTTVALKLGELTGRAVYDSDAEITRLTGTAPAVILKERGEPEFRRIESEVIKDLCKKENSVISTGGGVVTREENFGPLRESGVVIWLKKDLDLLSDEDRPLLRSRGAQALYREREPLYTGFAHVSVDISPDADTSARMVLDAVKDFVR